MCCLDSALKSFTSYTFLSAGLSSICTKASKNLLMNMRHVQRHTPKKPRPKTETKIQTSNKWIIEAPIIDSIETCVCFMLFAYWKPAVA